MWVSLFLTWFFNFILTYRFLVGHESYRRYFVRDHCVISQVQPMLGGSTRHCHGSHSSSSLFFLLRQVSEILLI